MLGYEFYSIQEMVDKTETQRKEVKYTLGSGQFHPEKASIFHNQKPEVASKLWKTFQTVPLREFLAKSGTAGIAGATYLVADAVHIHLMGASRVTDKVPLFAAEVVNSWAGGDLLVNIAKRESEGTTFKWVMQPKPTSSGAAAPTETPGAVKATLSPKSFNVAPRITNDLLEDAGFPLIEWCLTQAGQQLGQYATDLAIADVVAAADGDGTQVSVTAGADTTTSAHAVESIRELGSEFWNPNTMICTYEAWGDAIQTTAAYAGTSYPSIPTGYDAKFLCCDVIFNNSKNLHAGVTAGKMTNCVTMMLDRTAALLCGRKRWLRIDNYSNPVRDLAGAVVSCRQDSVTLYKDATAKIHET